MGQVDIKKALRTACAQQLKRIPSNLPNKPETEDDRKTYLETFAKYAKSPIHAQQVMDVLIETCEFYPKVSQIVTMCQQISGSMELPPGCSRCNGDPYVVIERNGTDVAARCECQRGKFLSAMDQARR